MKNGKQRKDNGYSVLGVLALMVAVVGGTFAYFSAAVSSTGSAISGGTYDELSGSLSLTISKLNLGGTAASDKLVPTNLVADNINAIKAAVTGKCESAGYTACHVYKITATTTQNLANVKVKLDSLTVSGSTKVPTDWKYSVYTGTDTVPATIVTSGQFNVSTAVNMYDAALNNTNKVLYLMIFLKDDNAIQNAGDANDATGTYSGTVSMSAGTGEVKADFTFSS